MSWQGPQVSTVGGPLEKFRFKQACHLWPPNGRDSSSSHYIQSLTDHLGAKQVALSLNGRGRIQLHPWAWETSFSWCSSRKRRPKNWNGKQARVYPTSAVQKLFEDNWCSPLEMLDCQTKDETAHEAPVCEDVSLPRTRPKGKVSIHNILTRRFQLGDIATKAQPEVTWVGTTNRQWWHWQIKWHPKVHLHCICQQQQKPRVCTHSKR